MENHKRILGFLYIISGSVQILGMILLATLFEVLIPFIGELAEPEAQWVFAWLVPFIRIIAIGVVLIFAIPAILAGAGLLNQKKWALTLVLILGCLKLFSFPIGTAIGVYTIWVYAEDNKAKPQTT
ncbi:MAG TPA: hypothetical protein PLM56_09390 [Cyclobacteriaceae bacterium]|jgi:hypothetical protein|nr:hypothetical protein [Cytophagales bacterium]HRE65858.1 hypothetical protein [Cyclobacteriaceae bacterium]HRF33702.1 hypothetical protein [Cyclobacteriaceae bacterium]